MEASGTGNMKLALNGALTIGTLDGANIEILERVGDGQHLHLRPDRGGGGGAPPAGQRARDDRRLPALREVLDAVAYGVFSPDEPQRYRELVDDLTDNDHFMVTADFDAYAEAQRMVAARWRDRHAWWRASVLNTANMGWFSSDRASANTRPRSGPCRWHPSGRNAAPRFQQTGSPGAVCGDTQRGLTAASTGRMVFSPRNWLNQLCAALVIPGWQS